jgi:hypothetical protein
VGKPLLHHRIKSLGSKRLVGCKAGGFEDGSLKAKKLAGGKARGFDMALGWGHDVVRLKI